MESPLQVTFRGFPSSEAVTERILSKVRKLEQRFGRIISCRVVIASPHQHQQKGKTFRVSVDLVIPGAEILASRDPGRDHAHEDVYVAIRDAFDAVARTLEGRVRHSQSEARPSASAEHDRLVG
jgi:ribosome-associated translation inhibitor RaiA